MKTLNHLFSTASILVLVLVFPACSWFEQDIDGNLKAILSVSESQTGSNLGYNTLQILDATSDKDIADNIDKIKDWSVKEITYQIFTFSGASGATINGTIGFGAISSTSPSVTITISNVNLETSATSGTKYKLNLTEAQLKTIAGYLDKDLGVKVYMNGTLSQGPAYFDIEVFAKVAVTAKL